MRCSRCWRRGWCVTQDASRTPWRSTTASCRVSRLTRFCPCDGNEPPDGLPREHACGRTLETRPPGDPDQPSDEDALITRDLAIAPRVDAIEKRLVRDGPW